MLDKFSTTIFSKDISFHVLSSILFSRETILRISVVRPHSEVETSYVFSRSRESPIFNSWRIDTPRVDFGESWRIFADLERIPLYYGRGNLALASHFASKITATLKANRSYKGWMHVPDTVTKSNRVYARRFKRWISIACAYVCIRRASDRLPCGSFHVSILSSVSFYLNFSFFSFFPSLFFCP